MIIADLNTQRSDLAVASTFEASAAIAPGPKAGSNASNAKRENIRMVGPLFPAARFRGGRTKIRTWDLCDVNTAL